MLYPNQKVKLVANYKKGWESDYVTEEKANVLLKSQGTYSELITGDQVTRILLDWDRPCMSMTSPEEDYENARRIQQLVYNRFPEAGSIDDICTSYKRCRPYKGKYKQSIRLTLTRVCCRWKDTKKILLDRGFTEDEWDVSIYNKSRCIMCVNQYKPDDSTRTVLTPLPLLSDHTFTRAQSYFLGSILDGSETYLEPNVSNEKEREPVARSAHPSFSISSQENRDLLKQMVFGLSAKRAEPYMKWMKVCIAILRIGQRDESEGAYAFVKSLVHEFSKKCPHKYSEAGTDEFIAQHRVLSENGYGFSYLKRKLTKDNPDLSRSLSAQYSRDEVLEELLRVFFEERMSHETAGTLVNYLMRDKGFICEKKTKKLWVFDEDDNKWCEDTNDCLREWMKECVTPLFRKRRDYFKQKADQCDDEDEKNKYRGKEAEYSEALLKFSTIPYQENVFTALTSIKTRKAEKFALRLDNKSTLFVFKNGVLDLKQGEFRKLRPSDMTSKVCDFEYIPDTKFDRIEKFIEDITPDHETAHSLKVLIASALDGSCGSGVLPFLVGNGGNGKSILGNILLAAFGDYCMQLSCNYFTMEDKSKNAAEPTLRNVKGCRLVITSELSAKVPFISRIAKTFTSTDVITTRGLFEGTIQFRPQHKVMIFTNHKPEFDDPDSGISRRLFICKFPHLFRDSTDAGYNPLKHKVANSEFEGEEAQAELARELIHMAVHYYFNHYVPNRKIVPKSESILNETKTFREKINPVKDWLNYLIDEKVLVPVLPDESDKYEEIELSSLHTRYLDENTEVSRNLSQKEFGNLLRMGGDFSTDRSKKKHRRTILLGYRFSERNGINEDE